MLPPAFSPAISLQCTQPSLEKQETGQGWKRYWGLAYHGGLAASPDLWGALVSHLPVGVPVLGKRSSHSTALPVRPQCPHTNPV